MDQIVYHDRYRDRECIEKVYGDKALRWTYGTIAGRISLSVLVKRAAFSHWYGWKMDRPGTRDKIPGFIEEYELDASEFESKVEDFANFNEFFFRKLRPEARPINAEPLSAVFPADGRHLCIPDISQSAGLIVKGEMFDLKRLLDNETLAEKYAAGSLIMSRLCPVDYHRFHFPVAGKPGVTKLVNGPLYSVNPIALRQNIDILTSNKRTITELESDIFGKVLVMEIGATCVGGICQTYEPGTLVSKGAEKGYFRFGGSCTMMIFPPGKIRFDSDLVNHSAQYRELYAKVGDRMGTVIS